ncbi:MAG: trypsin-like peptidase domain-containing protein [Pseudomonadota bacterium]
MEPHETTYPCPHCAEAIQRQAVSCRFCGRDVVWNVSISRKPPPASLPAVLKELFERMGKKRFPSYGSMRKIAELPDHVLLTGLSREEAETAGTILSAGGGGARLDLDRTEFITPPEPPKKKRPAVQFLIAAAALISCAAFFFLRKPPVIPSSPPPVREVPVILEPLVPTKEEPSVPPSAKEDVQKHLKSLIEATATLSGNGVTGSAFFISSSGYLITNNHVTERMRNISVQTSDGVTRPGQLVRSDPRLDLALVKADGGPYAVLKLGDATVLEQGETVWTIGAPHGLSFTVTRGIASFIGRNVNGRAFIQADVAINPGNSGGPMINERGEVVGINNFIVSNAVGLNFAIPINYIHMGSDSIANDIIPIQPDNAVMAKWRSYTNGDSRASAQARTADEPVTDELQRLVQRSSELQTQFNQKKSQREKTIARFQSQLTEQQQRYQGGGETISQETARGAQVRNLTQQLLKEQIALADEMLEYCGQQESLLTEIRNSAGGDPLSEQASAQIGKIRELRTATESSKNKILSDLRDTQEQMY